MTRGAAVSNRRLSAKSLRVRPHLEAALAERADLLASEIDTKEVSDPG
jgi:hypothetical protein